MAVVGGMLIVLKPLMSALQHVVPAKEPVLRNLLSVTLCSVHMAWSNTEMIMVVSIVDVLILAWNTTAQLVLDVSSNSTSTNLVINN